VDALGMIGPITVVSEGSIGSNTRRIEAVTGVGSLALLSEHQRSLQETARLLKVEPGGVLEALERVLERQRQADKELARLRGERLEEQAAQMFSQAVDGVVVWREDGRSAEELRDLAQALRGAGAEVVVLAGSPDGSKVALVIASGSGSVDAGATAKELAAIVRGGGGGTNQLAQAGGSDVSKIDELLSEARRRLGDA
jgi:alanyl-tRNA synthetase